MHRLGLADAMDARHRLQVALWVPVCMHEWMETGMGDAVGGASQTAGAAGDGMLEQSEMLLPAPLLVPPAVDTSAAPEHPNSRKAWNQAGSAGDSQRRRLQVQAPTSLTGVVQDARLQQREWNKADRGSAAGAGAEHKRAWRRAPDRACMPSSPPARPPPSPPPLTSAVCKLTPSPPARVLSR